MDTLPDIGCQPDYGLAEQPAFAVDTVQFGDGYAQRRPAGLNSTRREWSVTWTALPDLDAETLKQFLLSRQGVYAFWWRIPKSDEVVRVLCKEPPRVTYAYPRHSNVTATFTEDFAP